MPYVDNLNLPFKKGSWPPEAHSLPPTKHGTPEGMPCSVQKKSIKEW